MVAETTQPQFSELIEGKGIFTQIFQEADCPFVPVSKLWASSAIKAIKEAGTTLEALEESEGKGAKRLWDKFQDLRSRISEAQFNEIKTASGRGSRDVLLVLAKMKDVAKQNDDALRALWKSFRSHHEMSPKQIRDWMATPEGQRRCKAYSTINLRGQGLKVIPPEIKYFTEARFLFFNQNQIEVIPPEMKKLIHAQLIYLEDNKISVIPKEIAQNDGSDVFPELRGLDLRGNPIKEKPPRTTLRPKIITD